MLGYGHIASGIILGGSWRTPSKKAWLMLLLGAIFAYLPDLDAIYYFITHRCICLGPDFVHHQWISHTLLPYFGIYLLILVVGRITKRRKVFVIGYLFLAGIILHLVLDTLMSVDGIMWLYPFSTEQFLVAQIGSEHGMAFQSNLVKTPWFLMEIALYVGGLMSIAAQTRLRRLLNPSSVILILIVILAFFSFWLYAPAGLHFPYTVPQAFNALAFLLLVYFGFMLLIFVLRTVPTFHDIMSRFSWRQLSYRSHSSIVLVYCYVVPIMVLAYSFVRFLPTSFEPWAIFLIAICFPSGIAFLTSTHVGQYGGLIGNFLGFLILGGVGAAPEVIGEDLWPYSFLLLVGFIAGWLGGWLARGRVIVSYNLMSLRVTVVEIGWRMEFISRTARDLAGQAVKLVTGRKGKICRDRGAATLAQQLSSASGNFQEINRELHWRLAEVPSSTIVKDIFLDRPLTQSLTQLHEDLGNIFRFLRVHLYMSPSEDRNQSLRVYLWAYCETPSAIWACTKGARILEQVAKELQTDLTAKDAQVEIEPITNGPLLIQYYPFGPFQRSNYEIMTREPLRTQRSLKASELSESADLKASFMRPDSSLSVWSKLHRKGVAITLFIIGNIVMTLMTDLVITALKD
jgi:hypothetical protein